MVVLLLVAFFFLSIAFPLLLQFASKPFSSIKYAIIDTFKYFRYKKYNEPKCGKLIGITGYFGKGKTLTGVNEALSFERRYEGKKWYDESMKKWRTNRVVILSNCEIKCKHFVFLESLDQMCRMALTMYQDESREDENTCTAIFTLLDESGAKLASRNFKTNCDETFTSTLLTCRKFHLSFYYTTQRFNLTDKLLRDVTLYVYDVHKVWRGVQVDVYDAWEMENANNPEALKPYRRFTYFAFPWLFHSYNTMATVGDLDRDCRAGNRMSSAEILALRGDTMPDMNNVVKPSKKYRKNH